MTTLHFSAAGARIAALALLTGSGLLLLPSLAGAQGIAVPQRISAGDAAKLEAEPATTGSLAEPTSNCERARRRLWVEGEGWVVRRVTTCR